VACDPVSNCREAKSFETDLLGDSLPGDRSVNSKFFAWIDSVGGYLVLLGDSLVLGQAVPESNVDIPVLADIQRRHLLISRSHGDYLIEPFAEVRINDQPVFGKSLLKHSDRITIGRELNVVFSQPHVLSDSARLDIRSRHRTRPFSDAILLMAESCVLGASADNHVVCPGWSRDVLLFRDGPQIKCRSMQAFAVNGRFCDGQAILRPNCRVEGEDFSLSLEQASA